MRSHNIYNLSKRGFTLIEIVIAMAILAVVLSMGLFMSMDTLHATYSRSEQGTVVGLLQRARSRALANIYQTQWGVCYVAPNYIVFQGTVCDPANASNEATAAGTGASIVGLTQASPVVFTALSGTTSPATVVVSDQNKTTTISINYEGTIIW